MSEEFERHRQRGFEFIQAGRLEEALAELWAGRDLSPEDAWTRRSLGEVLSRLGQKEAAIAEFQEVIRLQPDYEDAHHSLVHALLKAERFVEALAVVRQALLVCPNSASLHSYFGYLLGIEANKTKDKLGLEASAAAFQKAIDIDPANSSVLRLRGTLSWKRGRKHEAVAAFKAAVAVDPSNLEAILQLGKAQARTGDLRGMVQAIHAILDLPETNEKKQYLADRDRSATQFLLVSAGLASLLVGVWIWNRRRGK